MTGTVADAPLLATKLFVPSPRRNRVSRARLRDQLDAASGGTVTLAAAPAGSGKSTLLADWASTAKRRVAWLSLDPEDDDPRRFIHYLIAALTNAGIISPTDAFAGVSATNAEAIDAIVAELLNAVVERQVAGVLVLDDYHAIENESVHAVVQRIIDHLPANLHLVLASRIDPPLALSRLRARDMLLEIRASDLRFTDEEAAQFFNESMGLSLTPEQISELEKRTEGWAVGLQMAAISLKGQSGARNFIASFSGSNRYVLDYLTDEVLQRQSLEVRTFLLETSILERLSAPLCDAVTRRTNSGRILEQLDSANLFLIPLDDVRFWYRYHHLFGSLLLHELERSASAQTIAELHRRASGWYELMRLPEQALRHAVAAHDDHHAVAIVSRHAKPHILAGDGATIIRWIAELPRQRVESDFDLLMTHALALLAEFQLAPASRELDCAERVIPKETHEQGEGAILSLRGMVERMSGDAPRAAASLERAITLLDPKDFWYSMASFHLAIGAFMEPDLPKAIKHFAETAAYHDQPDGMLTAVLSQLYGGWCHIWNGSPDEAVAMSIEGLRWIDEWASTHGTGRPLSSLAYAIQAAAHSLWNQVDKAYEFVHLALDAGRTGFFIGYIDACGVMSQIAEAQGDWTVALTAARDAARAVRCAGNAESLGPVEAMEYRVLWRRGLMTGNRDDIDTVIRWCEQSGFLRVDQWRQHLACGLHHDYPLIIAARVLMHQKRYDEAQRLLDALLEEAVHRQRVPAQITLLILRSLVDAALDRHDSAVAIMRRALEIASKPRYVRLFLEEGSAALPIVERAAARISDRNFATRVLSAFEVPLKPHATLPEALSDREIEVLKLIAAGASNQDAARKLFVAPSTVKKHLENIYAKLSVGGRTQAVARARELKIL